jgi:hypothetical protein
MEAYIVAKEPVVISSWSERDTFETPVYSFVGEAQLKQSSRGVSQWVYVGKSGRPDSWDATKRNRGETANRGGNGRRNSV